MEKVQKRWCNPKIAFLEQLTRKNKLNTGLSDMQSEENAKKLKFNPQVLFLGSVPVYPKVSH